MANLDWTGWTGRARWLLFWRIEQLPSDSLLFEEFISRWKRIRSGVGASGRATYPPPLWFRSRPPYGVHSLAPPLGCGFVDVPQPFGFSPTPHAQERPVRPLRGPCRALKGHREGLCHRAHFKPFLGADLEFHTPEASASARRNLSDVFFHGMGP